MILFLTYHKVAAASESDADFYTVSRNRLAQQLGGAGRGGQIAYSLRAPDPAP